ncbi:LOW QUALITY PROTEIN: protein brambleberry-like [Liolophura sinensis]|uniref:LOW QUALITY PROTEIN: protein brambleberry-like n=1 Tax=Liolophura sinensis TaxID=3198878 RepID=UPI003158DC64
MALRRTVLLFIFLGLLFPFTETSFMGWLFGDDEQDGGTEKKTGIAARDSSRFEMLSTDEKFLEYSKTLAELSPLDECYHIVIYSLRKKCSELTEEELGKLSVQLLNCQSEAEERAVYPCTAKMSIAECTKNMDPTTWNSYQIVSNRARAMCYAAQQTQFRKMTELTVNQLVAQAGNQLATMKDLQAGQEQLHEVTSDTMQKMFDSQQQLISNQEVLRSAQKNVYTNIANNLRQLTREKALISTGNRELAEMTERIKEKLDKATTQMVNQEEKQQISHQEIMKDLQQIREKAQNVLGKIDNSSTHILKYHVDMMGHYHTTLDNLQKINTTISYIQNTITEMRTGFETRLGWLAQILGGAEERISTLTIAVLHFGYFVLAAISAAFLQTPMVSRVVLLIIVPLNAISEMKQGVSMDFTSMTLFIIITIAANWAVTYALRKHRRNNSGDDLLALTSPLLPDPPNVTPTTEVNGFIGGRPIGRLNSVEIQHLTNTLERLYRSLNVHNSSTDSGTDSFATSPRSSTPTRHFPTSTSVLRTPATQPPTPMPSSSSAFSPVTSTREDREVELASAGATY